MKQRLFPGTARAAGLTLTELLVGLAIGAVVLAPLAPMLHSAGAAARIAEDRVALEREADFALERIAARIRSTNATAGLTDKPSSEWFKPAVVYSVTAAGALVEQQGKDSYVLAESVQDFSLAALVPESGQPLIKVSLSLARAVGTGTNTGADSTATTTATTTVRLGSAL